MIALTARQRDALAKIKAAIAIDGVPPTCEELGRRMGINKVTAWGHVGALVRKGCLIRAGRGTRNLRLADTCPTCGRAFDGDGRVQVTVKNEGSINADNTEAT